MAERSCDILLYGTMADIGPTVRDDLAGRHTVALVEFAQNTPRDFFGYRRVLLKAIEQYHPRAVLPIGDSLHMARVAEEFADQQCDSPRFIVASSHAVDILDSKVKTYALASQLGIRQPRRFSLEEICEHGSMPGAGYDEKEGIGIIFKRDTSFGGSGVHRPRNVDSLRHLIEHENGTPYLIEEYIDGEDLSVDCIRMNDYFRAEAYVSTGRVYTQGPAVERRKTECPDAVKMAEKILGHLDYQGVCGFDFRRTEDGTVYLLECNPRFTGGLKTQIESGFDIPLILVDDKSRRIEMCEQPPCILTDFC